VAYLSGRAVIEPTLEAAAADDVAAAAGEIQQARWAGPYSGGIAPEPDEQRARTVLLARETLDEFGETDAPIGVHHSTRTAYSPANVELMRFAL
jgi:hypothetical protein